MRRQKTLVESSLKYHAKTKSQKPSQRIRTKFRLIHSRDREVSFLNVNREKKACISLSNQTLRLLPESLQPREKSFALSVLRQLKRQTRQSLIAAIILSASNASDDGSIKPKTSARFVSAQSRRLQLKTLRDKKSFKL